MINSFILEEGKKYIYGSFALAILSYLFICDTLATLAFLAGLAFVFIYRNNQVVKAKCDSYVSPVDGKVFAIDQRKNKTVIYIDVSICNSHQVIAPIDCEYKTKSIRHGLNLSGFTFKSNILNSSKTFKFNDLKLELLSGKCNINHDFAKDKNVEQYEKIGTFLHGTAIISIPNEYKIVTKISQKIKAGDIL